MIIAIALPPYWLDATESEWEEFAKAERGETRAGHKYIKRVRIADNPKTGGARYRYYYSDSSIAHRADQGDVINLREHGGLVEVVSTDGRTIEIKHEDGSHEKVQLHELHERLFEAWKERAVKGAERVAKQWASQHLGGKRTSAVAAFDASSPGGMKKVHDKVKRALAGAKLDDWQARSLVVFLCQREGWSADAQAAITDLMVKGTKDTALVAGNARMLIRASENLASADGGKVVTAEHVVEAALARFPSDVSPKDDGFAEKWSALKAKLDTQNGQTEAAVATLEGIIESGQKVPEAVTAFVKGAAKFEAGFEAQRLAQAFPGLRNDPGLLRHQELEARFRAATAKIESKAAIAQSTGVASTCYIADKNGFPVPRPVRYRVIEADKVIASHLAERGFSKNPAYPPGVQERVYHIDKAEQAKVRGNADRFKPELIHNTNPDAVNGPPVVTADGIVLGGNSRAMSMQLLYGEGRGAIVKDHLAANAYQFGLDRAAVEKMTAPILVREMEDVDVNSSSKDDLKDLVRATNESFTQSMDPRTMQVALAQKLSQNVIDHLADLPVDSTLAAYLTDGQTGKAFVASLSASGIIDRRNRSQYVRDDGLLNNDGKILVERLLVGKMVPNAELLGEVGNAQMSVLARIAPYVMSASTASPGHDLTADLAVAVRAEVDRSYSNHKDLDSYLKQSTLPGILGEHPIKSNERARVLYDALKLGPLTVTRVMRAYAESAQFDRGGQGGLFGEPTPPLEQLKAAIKKFGAGGEKPEAAPRGGTADMFKAHGFRLPIRIMVRPGTGGSGAAVLEDILRKAFGGPFIGPRGGKWANPEHTIPWDPNATGPHEKKHEEIVDPMIGHPYSMTERDTRVEDTKAKHDKAAAEWNEKNTILKPGETPEQGHKRYEEEKAAAKKKADDEAWQKRQAMLGTTETPEHLPENQDHYFTKPEGSVEVSIDKLKNTRARPEGIENAAKYMELARIGKIPKRVPISLKEEEDGTYTILDGNSTFAIAKKYGWSKVRGVVTEKASDKPKADNSHEAKAAAHLREADKHHKLAEFHRAHGGEESATLAAHHAAMADEHQAQGGLTESGKLKGPLGRDEVSNVLEGLGGGDWSEKFGVMVPRDDAAVNKAWEAKRADIAKRIGDIPSGRPWPAVQDEWSNDHATTPEALADVAERTAPMYTAAIRAITSKIPGSKALFGPNDMFANKALGSLSRKVRDSSARSKHTPEGIVSHRINDAIRGTIAVNSPEDLGKAVRSVADAVGIENISIDNKFVGNGYGSGYVGVHATIHFKDANGTRMQAELQFHLESMFDGSMKNPKEQAHKLYEVSRSQATVDPKLEVASKAMYLTWMHREQP